MTRDDIIRMAREAGLMFPSRWHPEVERFAIAVAAAERNAIIEMIPGGHSVDPQWVCDAIRARGQEFARATQTDGDPKLDANNRQEKGATPPAPAPR